MRSLRILRETQRRASREATGISERAPRLQVRQVGSQHLDAEILALPQRLDDLVALQDNDGNFFWQLDYSDFLGTDVLA